VNTSEFGTPPQIGGILESHLPDMFQISAGRFQTKGILLKKKKRGNPI
jgi:hypothetical protein